MLALAIETSCDDTSVAVVKDGNKVLSSIVSSQASIHSRYGGVVPEVAARNHLSNILPVIDEALKKAKVRKQSLDYLAVTAGPGLVGSLIVGVNTAKLLAYTHHLPLVAVHHTGGHIYANWLKDNLEKNKKPPQFPLVCLTVSGGHSNLIYMKDHLRYKIIGDTLDDSAGEAYDKVAKMLGLGYPGGPIISQKALSGDDQAFQFPQVDLTPSPFRNESGFLENPNPSLDFSFSGLKTAVLRVTKENENLTERNIADISASFQRTINEILIRNLDRAISTYAPRSVLLSGGVSANKHLRHLFTLLLEDKYPNTTYFLPQAKYCTDNAAMIAAAAHRHYLINDYTDAFVLTPDPNFKLAEK